HVTSDVSFSYCSFLSGTTSGINHDSRFYASRISLDYCTAAFNGTYGILITTRTRDWTVHGCTVYSNGQTFLPGTVEETWGGGIKIVGESATRHMIRYNFVYWNGFRENGSIRVHPIPNKGFGIWVDLV